jgi:hypothetical protein
MKVLFLHPEDKLPPSWDGGWELIVDLSRRPPSTYRLWSEQAGCRVVSLYQYFRGFEDMYRLQPAIQLANGIVVDKYGIDWWKVLFPMLLSDMEQGFMLLGLVRELGDSVQIYCSRPDARASVLAKYLNAECRTLHGGSNVGRKIRHYKHAFAHLDFGQLTQIAFDKFDSEHSVRRRFARKSRGDSPVFLLPTAYINVSRTAVSYASLLPEQRFLLAVARPGGKLASLPSNVRTISLDAYFERIDHEEFAVLNKKWESLVSRLDTPEFRMASASGVLQRGHGLIRWGLAARDAWIRLFESETIAGCLSADDVNPYTSLPLFIARQRKIPTVAVHHGALDGRMAAKPIIADHYLAKGELERDYLLETCRVDPERIVVGSGPQATVVPTMSVEKPWLVFFTEPYGALGWRMDDVYQELFPPLWELAERSGLKLVFKLHPFESIKGHKNLLKKFLTKEQLARITWIAGPTTPELWSKTRFAMTVESTIALECVIRQVPIFLCGWLRRAYGGYIQQYAKFGVGHILNSPDGMQDIPQLLANWQTPKSAADNIWKTIEPSELLRLLTGSGRQRGVTSAQVIAS